MTATPTDHDAQAAAAPEPPVAELRGVFKSYRSKRLETPVLFDVNLRVRPGEFVAVVGASGSGKTTLLNLLGLLDTPTSGEVRLRGQDTAKLAEPERAGLRRDYLGFIFQFHYLLPEFNVLENALMPCRLRGREQEKRHEARIAETLRRVGLGDRLHHRPAELSGGQQQRVAIVRALANDPPLVLADEPTGNLDSHAGREVFGLMKDLSRSAGKAFLLVTHDESFARQADRVINIEDGRVREG